MKSLDIPIQFGVLVLQKVCCYLVVAQFACDRFFAHYCWLQVVLEEDFH